MKEARFLAKAQGTPRGGQDEDAGRTFSSKAMVMQIHVSPSDGVPIYLQIVNQVKYLAAARRLAPGEQLPPVRKLAEQLLVNPNTVARAYRELERAGLVESRRGAGVFLSKSAASPLARRERTRILSQRIDMLLAEARQMGIRLEAVIELVHERHRRFERDGEEEVG